MYIVHWEIEALTIMKQIFDWYFVENDIVHIVYIWDNRQSLSKMNILVK